MVADDGAFAMMDEAWRIVGQPRFGGLLIAADHASDRVPDDMDLGLPNHLMGEHIAVDIGVAGIAEAMAQQAGAAAFLGNVSRLVCDTNREESDPAAIPEMSDGHAIPGNIGIDREERLGRFHRPYHTALAEVLETSPPGLTLVLHSFTPCLKQQPDTIRPWECGVLYDRDDRGARAAVPMLEAEGLMVGDQEPYSGRQYNAVIKRHFENDGRPYLYLEIRQDLIGNSAGQRQWAERLHRICNRIAIDIMA